MTQLDPRRTGLVLFDMLECYRPAIERDGTIEPTRRLIEGCRSRGVPIFYARAGRAHAISLLSSLAHRR